MSDQQVTLTALFKQAGTAMRIYDLGRRIRAFSADEFERIETQATPYPTPYLQHAWIALLLWNPKSADENAVWFLKLPLDEQGFLLSAVRDDIVNRLLQNVQSSIDGVPTEDSLKENPFAFKPSDEKMALFHAKAALDNHQAASAYYEPVQQFISQPNLDTGWENLSLQGLADFVVRLEQSGNEATLVNALNQLPEGLHAQVLGLLEHAKPSSDLSEKLLHQLTEALSENRDPVLISLLIRALSSAKTESHTHQAIEAVLNSSAAQSAELLAAIATRCENALLEPTLLTLFLEALAQCDAGQNAFSRILADLMYLPVHRVLMVQALRSPSGSDALKQATDQMFGPHFRQPQ